MKRALTLLLAMAAACGQNQGGDAPAGDAATARASGAPVPSTAAPRSSIKPPGHAYADADVPVPGDFADAVEKDVTDANYKEQLAALQTEVADAMKAQGMQPTPAASHAHEHEHDGGEKHSHPHGHEKGKDHEHDHPHKHADGTSRGQPHEDGDRHEHKH